MLPLYLDEDSIDRELVAALRARGIDVLTAAEAGLMGRSDPEHLEFATRQQRVLYTFNRGDFYRLHTQYLSEGRLHAGMILAPQQRYSVGTQMRQVLEILNTRNVEEMRNNVVFLKD